MTRHANWPSLVAATLFIVSGLPAGASAQAALFNAARDSVVGVNPFSVAAADLSGDGKLDLVVANYASNSVSVVLADASGAFGTSVAYPAGGNPHGVAVADLNGDGKRDVVVANYGSADVSVLLGNGDGTLQSAVSY